MIRKVITHYPEFGTALDIRWTYQDYRDRANAVAKGLLALGLNIGTLAALCLGSTLHPTLTFDPLKALQIISREHCAFSGLAGKMVRKNVMTPIPHFIASR